MIVAGGALVAAVAAAAIRLPKTLTTPTGNFITLYSVSTSGGVTNADVKICTSAHTPAGTEAFPPFFTLKLSNGTTQFVRLGAKSPALKTTPLGPKQCVRGWLLFKTPAGAHPTELVYTYPTAIYWKL
jgi:hypothetical protein